jgi:hypothetical protein
MAQPHKKHDDPGRCVAASRRSMSVAVDHVICAGAFRYGAGSRNRTRTISLERAMAAVAIRSPPEVDPLACSEAPEKNRTRLQTLTAVI